MLLWRLEPAGLSDKQRDGKQEYRAIIPESGISADQKPTSKVDVSSKSSKMAQEGKMT